MYAQDILKNKGLVPGSDRLTCGAQLHMFEHKNVKERKGKENKSSTIHTQQHGHVLVQCTSYMFS